MQNASRRAFLAQLGHGALLAAAGSAVADELAAQPTGRPRPRIRGTRLGGDIERLAAIMQQTGADQLMARLVDELEAGTTLSTLVAAGSIANARAFAGEDYDGYHVQMALLPARQMAQLMPERLAALPVLKVLHRNTRRIHATGGARNRLAKVDSLDVGGDAGRALLQSTRDCELKKSEQLFLGMCEKSVEGTLEDLHALARDEHNVHRIVLAWRAWDMLPVVGEQHAHDMLRQFVRFCVDHERDRERNRRPAPAIRRVVPKVLDQHRLIGMELGNRRPDDAFVGKLRETVFGSDRERAADAVGAALGEGIDPEAIGEAISLAANQLLLHDPGKKRVHGASVGVHASDAANAWRHLARLGSDANRAANLVAGAYHTAGQSQNVGTQAYDYREQLTALDATPNDQLLSALERAIERRDQRAACAAARRYGDLGLPAPVIFDLLLRYACSEDGALHAEKYFHTAREEYRSTRAAYRWDHVVALARVTASEFGEPAPGYALARRLLS